ncbi:hypothetical protein [Marinobacterium stanieri]|uniref:MazG nucleotide pyrophosphohydrolase domain-containing protein n=1 Tax=Marinobacterium stanieri TaxID=49186 RepID=A0A1N6QEC4_9GAMM|nr:hypothetical protein [Marinobacterium stanieri]SIQ14736.1 hypothetical protein SAMN05421647_102439 [Marinobacterium stanieri]
MTNFTPTQLIAIDQTVSAWGLDKSIQRAGEELLELGLALQHFNRNKVGKEVVLNEMADVRIVLQHLEFIFGNYQTQLDAKVLKGCSQQQESDSCELECGAHGTFCRCKAEADLAEEAQS